MVTVDLHYTQSVLYPAAVAFFSNQLVYLVKSKSVKHF